MKESPILDLVRMIASGDRQNVILGHPPGGNGPSVHPVIGPQALSHSTPQESPKPKRGRQETHLWLLRD